MPDNGSGTYTREGGASNWVDDLNANVKIRADLHDLHDQDFATALNNRICKDGQTATTARIPFAFGISVADGTVGAPSIAFANSLTTGWYRIGANNAGFACAGAKVLDVATTGLAVTGTLSSTSTFTAGTLIQVNSTGTHAQLLANRTDTHGAAVVGNIIFQGKDSGAATQRYVELIANAVSDSAGVEEGSLSFNITTGGAATAQLTITGATTTVANAFAVNGNTTLGNAAGDTIVMNAASITKPNAPNFSAYNSAQDANVTGNGEIVTIDFDTEVFDRGGDFAADTYTADVTGIHGLGGCVALQGLTIGTSNVSVFVNTSNRQYQVIAEIATATTQMFAFTILSADMDAADTATITVQAGGSGTVVDVYGGSAPTATFFMGGLVA